METLHHSRVSIHQIGQVLQLPLLDAARHVGVCAAQLKRICRRHGIARWPQRKLLSVERMIEQKVATHRISPSALATLRLAVQELAALRQGPLGVVAEVPKLDEVLAHSEVQQLLREMNDWEPDSLFVRTSPTSEDPLLIARMPLVNKRSYHPPFMPSFSKTNQLSLRQQLSVPVTDVEIQYLKSRLSQFSEYYKQQER
eukprot:TRINITY_DN6573_c0_g2_i6.p1 TRINITY_DN6573_c0_g2~~TRINITY_DN6573_c0_g2_i6.p1  ORF type:complete len:199 (+),score=9.50 TRINITY_DN6573_c0_g2_i6:143-739(+)